jgi:DNA polymerase
MPRVASDYEQLLQATIQHLEELQAAGVRHVAVSPETLRALALPPPRPAVTASDRGERAQASAASIPVPPSATVAPALPLNLPGEAPPPRPAVDAGIARSRSGSEKAAALADLRARALACAKCPHLAASRKNVVFGVGNLDADLMFVGEAPGADEDEQGEPFVGKAGQLLTRIIETMGLRRSDVYIGNILKCRPDTPGQTAGNRKPTPEEMQTCLPYLQEQIDLIRPKVLVALGGTAMEGLLNLTGITKLRGHWHEYRGIPLMPTYHPSYLLRNQALHEKRRVWEDMLQVMERLGLPISERQRNFFLKG